MNELIAKKLGLHPNELVIEDSIVKNDAIADSGKTQESTRQTESLLNPVIKTLEDYRDNPDKLKQYSEKFLKEEIVVLQSKLKSGLEEIHKTNGNGWLGDDISTKDDMRYLSSEEKIKMEKQHDSDETGALEGNPNTPVKALDDMYNVLLDLATVPAIIQRMSKDTLIERMDSAYLDFKESMITYWDNLQRRY